jgi:hypothetical protein
MSLYLNTYLLSSSLLSKNINIKIHRNVNLPYVLYGPGTWSFALREELRLRPFENSAEESIWA